jgi:phospholipid/cholesterol/gamma-HCH transport system permease protein
METQGGGLFVVIGGNWRITSETPACTPSAAPAPAFVRVKFDALESWDSSLPLFLDKLMAWCQGAKIPFDLEGSPESLKLLLGQFEKARDTSTPKDRSINLFSLIGIESQHLWTEVMGISHFIGECVLSFVRLARNPARFRLQDCLAEMQQCGAMALPIVGLVSFLVGVTLAYTGAIILRLFGGDIWVADLIGLSITREMGAIMTAMVLAGRTGAAYAAQLGNMKANEELDALATLGVSPVDFLVVPRLLALALMTPLLAMYANCLGIIGGGVIAQTVLEIPPTAYWVEMLTIVDMSDVCTGLLKASTFGLIVGMSGCLRGMQAERSANGVGKAATSAVVTSILLMIVADALFAVIFNILGW